MEAEVQAEAEVETDSEAEAEPERRRISGPVEVLLVASRRGSGGRRH